MLKDLETNPQQSKWVRCRLEQICLSESLSYQNNRNRNLEPYLRALTYNYINF